MKIQVKADVSYSRELTCRAMAVTAPEQRGAAHNNQGFTLVELLMVIAIIGVLSLMVIPQYSNLKNRAQNSRCKSEIRTVEKSIIAYNLDKGSFPNLLDATITTTLTDPWGHLYQYYNIQLNGAGGDYKDPATNDINTDFDLYSMGVNGLGVHNLNSDLNCMDDIIRVADGRIVEEGKDF